MEQDRSIETLTEIGLSFLSTLGRGFPMAYAGGHSRSRMGLHVALFLQKMRASFVNVHVISSVKGDAQALLNDWSQSSMEYDTKHAGVLRLNSRVCFVSVRRREEFKKRRDNDEQLVQSMVRAAKCTTEDRDDSVSDMARYRTYQFRLAAVVAHHMCYFFLGSISGTGCNSLGSGTRKGRTVGEDLAQAWEQMVFGGTLRFGQETVSKRKECETYLALQDSTMRRVDPRAIDKIAGYRECLSLSFLHGSTTDSLGERRI